MISKMMKSVIVNDRAAILFCDLDHKMIYMNPAAEKQYARHGGKDLLGKSLFDCHNEDSNRKIKEVVEWFKKDKANNMIRIQYHESLMLDQYMVALRDDDGTLLGYYEKSECRRPEEADFYDFSRSLV